jgi:hypothetical protein
VGLFCTSLLLVWLGSQLILSLRLRLLAYYTALVFPKQPVGGKWLFIWCSCRLPFVHTNHHGHKTPLMELPAVSMKACIQTQQIYLGNKMVNNLCSYNKVFSPQKFVSSSLICFHRSLLTLKVIFVICCFSTFDSFLLLVHPTQKCSCL